MQINIYFCSLLAASVASCSVLRRSNKMDAPDQGNSSLAQKSQTINKLDGNESTKTSNELREKLIDEFFSRSENQTILQKKVINYETMCNKLEGYCLYVLDTYTEYAESGQLGNSMLPKDFTAENIVSMLHDPNAKTYIREKYFSTIKDIDIDIDTDTYMGIGTHAALLGDRRLAKFSDEYIDKNIDIYLYLWAIALDNKNLAEKISQENPRLVRRIKNKHRIYFTPKLQYLAAEQFEAGNEDFSEMIFPLKLGNSYKKTYRCTIDNVKIAVYAAMCHQPKFLEAILKNIKENKGGNATNGNPCIYQDKKKENAICFFTMSLLTTRCDKTEHDAKELKNQTIKMIFERLGSEMEFLLPYTLEYLLAPDASISKIELPPMPDWLRVLTRQEALDYLVEGIKSYAPDYIRLVKPYAIKYNHEDLFNACTEFAKAHQQTDPSCDPTFKQHMIDSLSNILKNDQLDTKSDLFKNYLDLLISYVINDPSLIKNITPNLIYIPNNQLINFNPLLNHINSHVKNDRSSIEKILQSLERYIEDYKTIKVDNSDIFDYLVSIVKPYVEEDKFYMSQLLRGIQACIDKIAVKPFNGFCNLIKFHVENNRSYTKNIADIIEYSIGRSDLNIDKANMLGRLASLIETHLKEDASYSEFILSIIYGAFSRTDEKPDRLTTEEYNKTIKAYFNFLGILFRSIKDHLANDEKYSVYMPNILDYVVKANDSDFFNDLCSFLKSCVNQYIEKYNHYIELVEADKKSIEENHRSKPNIPTNRCFKHRLYWLPQTLKATINNNNPVMLNTLLGVMQDLSEKKGILFSQICPNMLKDLSNHAAQKGNQEIIGLLKNFSEKQGVTTT